MLRSMRPGINHAVWLEGKLTTDKIHKVLYTWKFLKIWVEVFWDLLFNILIYKTWFLHSMNNKKTIFTINRVQKIIIDSIKPDSNYCNQYLSVADTLTIYL